MSKKDRTLYVMKYLRQNTDEEHPATVSDILAALADENIKVERHVLMSNMPLYLRLHLMGVMGVILLFGQEFLS